MTLIIKKIGETKRGVFTDRAFEEGAVVLKLDGIKLTTKEVSKLSSEQQSNVLQIGDNNYLNLEKELPFFIQHRCNPNCYVKAVVNSAFLIAVRPIAKGEEITFDYSLTSNDTEESWSMACDCHRYYCRKVISGFSTLPEEKCKEYIKQGRVPRYISRE